MCGRYVSPDVAAIEREFNLIRTPGLDIGPNYNVAPTQSVPVVRSVNGVRQLSLMRWRLVPFFANGIPGDVTMPAHSMMAEIHNAPGKQRMPVILDRKDYDAWLVGTVDEARAVLKQYPADEMEAWPVSTRVNTPKNNDAGWWRGFDDSQRRRPGNFD